MSYRSVFRTQPPCVGFYRRSGDETFAASFVRQLAGQRQTPAAATRAPSRFRSVRHDDSRTLFAARPSDTHPFVAIAVAAAAATAAVAVAAVAADHQP